MRAHSVRLSLCCALVLALAPLAARADDPTEAFRQGLSAAEKGNWREVERRMRQAIAAKDREGGSVKIYGMRFEEYLPHYYLGLALFNLNRCPEALSEWQIAESHGAVKKTGFYRTLQKSRDVCQARVATLPPKTPPPAATPTATPPPTPQPGPDPAALAAAMRRAESNIAEAEQTARVTRAMANKPPLAAVWNADARLGPAHKRGTEMIAVARGLLDSGRAKSDLALLERAASTARDAARQLSTVEQAATQLVLARALEVRPTATPATRQPGPPAELLAAVQAYFAGRYADAAGLLENRTFPERKAQTHALLMRGAARFALYSIGGERDGALLRAAQNDIRGARRLDPGLSPDARAFSPRFRELVARSR